METWFRRIFLAVCISIIASPAISQDDDADERDDEDLTVLDAVISPDLKRRKIREDKIDSEDFEFGVYAGLMNVEDFGSNNVYGARASFHINQDLFLDATYGETETSRTSFEVLSGGTTLLAGDQRDLVYYNLSLGVNLLPGEIFMGGKYAFNTNFYLIGGLGSTEFAGNDYFTYNFGAGLRVFMTDTVAARIDFRNHLFSHQIFGDEKSIQNLEGHFGLSFFF